MEEKEDITRTTVIKETENEEQPEVKFENETPTEIEDLIQPEEDVDPFADDDGLKNIDAHTRIEELQSGAGDSRWTSLLEVQRESLKLSKKTYKIAKKSSNNLEAISWVAVFIFAIICGADFAQGQIGNGIASLLAALLFMNNGFKLPNSRSAKSVKDAYQKFTQLNE